MPKYVKKPIVIDAVQWTGENNQEILKFCTSCYLTYSNEKLIPQLKIQTLEGLMTATVEDFIIKGIVGEFYPCKLEVFKMTYEQVTS